MSHSQTMTDHRRTQRCSISTTVLSTVG